MAGDKRIGKRSVTWFCTLENRPLDLLMLRLGANLDIHSRNTQFNGIFGYGLGQNFDQKICTGEDCPETLKNFANWQWPEIQFNLKMYNLIIKKKGFTATEGKLHWGGGELNYTFGQRQDRMNMPSLTAEMKDENGQLQIDVRDQQSQKMANLSLDPNLMLDVQLTQRMLLNVPSYQGKAGLDTYVIGSRQPLLQGGFNENNSTKTTACFVGSNSIKHRAFIYLYSFYGLCWKLASLFWLVVAPPQPIWFDRVALGSQQAQVPNISSFLHYLMNLLLRQHKIMSMWSCRAYCWVIKLFVIGGY